MEIHQKTILKPTRLRPGDTIGIAAPAGPFEKEGFLRGVAVLESMGFDVAFDDGIFEKRGYLAGSDEQRAAQVNRLFADPAVKAVFCARGGFGALRILSMIDYDSIRENPKIFAGYSDISALLSTMIEKCELVVFHGPMVSRLAEADRRTKDALHAALTSDVKLELTAPKGTVIHPGQASGPVAGGNLTTVCHLTGTPFAPDYKGRILLLEDKSEAPYRIDRMLSQMKLAGCFDGLAGLILGDFEDCGETAEIYRIIKDIFEDVNIPILAGFDIGHGGTNITVPLGLQATLDTDRQELSFHEPATV